MAKKENLKLNAIMDGQIIPVTEADDVVFSEKMIGDGYAVIPTSGDIYSPVAGVISKVAATKHSYYIQLEDDNKILIHVGEDTLLLNGKGFTVNVEKGSQIAPGDLLGTVDLDVMEEEDCKIVVSTIFLFNKDLDVDVTVYPNEAAVATKTPACVIEYQTLDS